MSGSSSTLYLPTGMSPTPGEWYTPAFKVVLDTLPEGGLATSLAVREDRDENVYQGLSDGKIRALLKTEEPIRQSLEGLGPVCVVRDLIKAQIAYIPDPGDGVAEMIEMRPEDFALMSFTLATTKRGYDRYRGNRLQTIVVQGRDV